MKSMNVVKNGWRNGFAAVLLATVVSTVPAKAAMVAGGTVPLENWFIAQGIDGLDIQSVGTSPILLGSIFINNNAPQSFVMTVTARNGGFLRAGLAAALPVLGVAAGAVGTGNPFAAPCNLVDGAAQAAGATWGPTVTALVTLGAAPGLAFTANNPGSAGTLTGGAASIATSNYRIDVNGSWAATTTMLAGYYVEVFTVGLVAKL
ncbi:MAG: hypothetical protein ABI036_08070 [Fibrobacteria bacterium]